MGEGYNPKEIEEKWQRYWEEQKTFAVSEEAGREKYYLLEMFPYPSGRIHMGHVRNYSIGDVVARYKMMRGYNVLHPMGWDAFGMPAENAAIDSGVHPAKWTYENIEYMKKQLKRMGFSYDWDRELATCDVLYYKWEQWLFLRMYEKKLVYKKKSLVNWCESCQTVLANEQVEGGLCWRCGLEVIQKELDQWFFKITHYTEELLDYCDKLTGWPEKVITMQKNWIGKSIGTEIDFPLEGSDRMIRVFTTRPDTLFGATFMSLAPENPLALELSRGTEQEEAVGSFVERVVKQDKIVRSAEDLEKEGVFTGAYCINPVTQFKMPIYVANFVLMEYGTGAVMAVPTHDQRDFEFAKKYNLDLVVVIQPEDKELRKEEMTEAYLDEGVMVNSGSFNGMQNLKAMDAITDHLEKKGCGERAVNYRLKDWGISRQRYWGNPIPVIYCDDCGTVPVPDRDLPVILPHEIEIKGMGGSPLKDCGKFVNTACPKCGKPARRETDTMDTFVESSWYFARYACPQYDEAPLDKDKVDYWMPVDQYIGGIEHAVLHLLYARFFTKVLRDIGLTRVDEPFSNLLTQGMVCKETLSCEEHGWLYPEEVVEGKCSQCRRPVQVGRIEKMSKSTKNVVDPESLIKKYGADTARLFCLFAAPPERDLDWSEQGVEGSYRFLSRVWRMVADNLSLLKPVRPFDGKSELDDRLSKLRFKTHTTIKKVTSDIEDRFHFNTAISGVMELVNAIYQFDLKKIKDELTLSVIKEAIKTVIVLLSPITPHIAEELWEKLGEKESSLKTPWPAYDASAMVEEEILIVIQVNGKLRSRITVPVDSSDGEVERIALSDEKTQGWIAGKEIKKVVVVPKKLVNVVVK
ncbi:MAG: leucine--tRNA ligase [Deltaproteobacteria bacterium]|nr:leucine--tRNA ligase [Deltaproteobacteria bacterium]